MKTVSSFLLLLALLACNGAAYAQPQLTLTVTGTASSANLGYTPGDSYSFVFRLDPFFPSTSGSSFSNVSDVWHNDPSETPLILSFTGSGIAGSFTPSASFGELGLGVSSGHSTLYIDTFIPPSGNTPIGLTANGTALNEVYLNLQPLLSSPLPFVRVSSYVSPGNYFSDYIGSYPIATELNQTFLILYASGSQQQFGVTNLQISGGSVPEPSSFALAAGIGILGLSLFVRRRARSKLVT
jgi:PEP-CTERM motif